MVFLLTFWKSEYLEINSMRTIFTKHLQNLEKFLTKILPTVDRLNQKHEADQDNGCHQAKKNRRGFHDEKDARDNDGPRIYDHDNECEARQSPPGMARSNQRNR
jgi:hypothetical protein